MCGRHPVIFRCVKYLEKSNIFFKVGYHIPFPYLKVSVASVVAPATKVAHLYVVSTDHRKLECGMKCLPVVSYLYQVLFKSVNGLKS